MRVRVQNVCDDQPFGARFESDVYAIDGNKFLVWDIGDEWNYPCFRWVDITEAYLENENDESCRYAVELVQEV